MSRLSFHKPNSALIQNEGGNFIRLSNCTGKIYTYCADIDAFAMEVERVTGKKVEWECGPALYFYRAWIEEDSQQPKELFYG